jgi:RHS repeat-associated protein
MIKKSIGQVVLFTLSSFLIQAQNIPKWSSNTAATPATVPGAYTNTWTNFIRVWQPNLPSNDTAYLKSASRTASEVGQTTTYHDGLGRLVQRVEKRMTFSGKDFVTPMLYDQYGRLILSYLPYAPKTGNTNDGKFKTDPFNQQSAFYKDTLLNPSAAGESIYYARMGYENAPGGRPIKTFAEGNNWAMEGGNRPVETRYQVNVVADSVRQYSVSDITQTPTSGGFYPAGSLFKETKTGEDGRKTIEFKDKMGRLILRKVQHSPAPGTAHVGWNCTYQVFNRNGKVAYILPPKLIDYIKAHWVVSTAIINELAFVFRYDQRERLIVQKDPGADSLEMVYDKRDRMVISRTGNLAQIGMAKAILYDTLNRMTGENLFYTEASRETLQWNMDTSMVINPANSVPFVPSAHMIPMYQIYYDNYNFPGSSPYLTADLNNARVGSNPYSESMPASASTKIKGFVTGKRSWDGSKDRWLTTTIYYNDKSREIQTIEDNYGGGKEVLNKVYDFSGKMLTSYLKHTNPQSSVTPQTTVHTLFHYDHSGRLDSISITLNDNPALARTIAVISYNETGQLLNERLNPSGASQLETLAFDYNIRKWTRGINKGYVNTVGSSSNWFGMEISYDHGFDSSEYNGNISGAKWKSRSDGLARAFGYSYDPCGRLTTGYYSQQNAGATNWSQTLMDFSVSGLSYDHNGNIMSMKQRGMDGQVQKTIDSLKYAYFPYSNRMYYVTDKVNDPSSNLGDFKEVVNAEQLDYWYDRNGNIAKDKNKDVDTIVYDHNNLPVYFKVKGRGDVYLVRGGDGEELAKVVTDTSNTYRTVITQYANGFIYINGKPEDGPGFDTLQSIAHDRGRIRAIYKSSQPVQFSFDYIIKDHLQNTRVVLATRSDTALYAATMETAAAAVENALFANVDATRSAKPVSYPTDNTTTPNDYISKTNGSTGQKIGPSKVLRVMAGDSITISAKGYYQNASATSSVNTAQAIVSSFLSAMSGVTLVEGVHEATGSNSPLSEFDGSIYSTVKNLDPAQNQVAQPKAYLNFVLFDDQFNLVAENSGVRQVQGSTGQLINLVVNKQAIKKTGWLYIYSSNESAVDVYFDNLIITHNAGPLQEEHHYYPFGLEMAAISSKTIKNSYIANRYLFNGKKFESGEFNDGWSSNLYDFGARLNDPQTGRFISMDPKASKMPAWSPYSAFYNNPIRFIDPDGQEPTPAEAARMAAHVYGDKKDNILTGGWRVSQRDFGIQLQNKNGLKSLVYERVVEGKVTEYTYATAGTEASWQDVGADVKQPLGISRQYASAVKNAEKLSEAVGETELTFTGHSLGGGEAALNALVTDRKAITFNAAGVGDITKILDGSMKTSFKSEKNIIAFILSTDPLNIIQNHTALPNVNGKRHYLLPRDGASIYNGHSMDNILKNFGIRKPGKYQK